MAIDIPCENCGGDISFEPDEQEDTPFVEVRRVFIEGGERHLGDKDKVRVCDGCREDVYQRMLGVVD